MKSTIQEDSLFKQNNKISILFFSLFSAWLLSIPFHGQLEYLLYHKYNKGMENISLILLTIHSLGLISSGYIVDSLDKAKKPLCT